VTLSRPLVVTARVLTQLRRDKRTLAMIVVQPVVIMAVFGYAFGGDVSDVRVGVANLDRGTLASRVLDGLDTTTVTVVPFGTGAEAEAAMRGGAVSMAVVFPANFTRNFESGSTQDPEVVVIEVYRDNANPQVTGAALEAFTDALVDAIEEETDRPAGVALDERILYGAEDARALDFFVPGIAAFAIFQLGSMLTVVAIVKERTLGTLPRILASPIRRWEIVAGYTAAFALLSLVQAGSVLAVATLIFRVSIAGSVLLALVATTLVGIAALGFGILVSGLARSEFQAIQSVFLVVFPMLFLSGVFAPAEAMPAFLRPVMAVIPLAYAVRALRGIISYGAGLDAVGLDLLVLAAFGAAFLLIATFSFGRKA